VKSDLRMDKFILSRAQAPAGKCISREELHHLKKKKLKAENSATHYRPRNSGNYSRPAFCYLHILHYILGHYKGFVSNKKDLCQCNETDLSRW